LYQTLLRDSSLFALLLRLDLDLAEQARLKGCRHCGGALHSARYARKPRGGPEELEPQLVLRDSFCCAVEECRRRVTPPSLRFLGRKVFFGVWVVLLPVLREGASRWTRSRIQEVFGVSARTLRRWQRWWREILPQSRFWQARRGDWAMPLSAEALPGSLLAAFAAQGQPCEQVLALLGWLAPLSFREERAF
jgi:hypothetical protein